MGRSVRFGKCECPSGRVPSLGRQRDSALRVKAPMSGGGHGTSASHGKLRPGRGLTDGSQDIADLGFCDFLARTCPLPCFLPRTRSARELPPMTGPS